MANRQHKATPSSAAAKANQQTALFRRAAQVAKTSQLLINETEQLLARTRQLAKEFEVHSIPKSVAR